MGNLTHFSTLLLTVYRQAQELPVDEFQDAVLSTVKQHLPFDKSIWGTGTLRDSGLNVHALQLHNTPQALMDAYEKVKHLEVAAFRVANHPSQTMAFNADTDFAGRELDPLRQFLHEHRVENCLISWNVNPLTRFAQGISLYLEDKTNICTEEETELLACLAPHLMQALAINRLVHLDRLAGELAREKWSVAIADGRGLVYHADRRFRELLAAEWKFDDQERLPPAVLEQLETEQGQLTGERIVVRASVERGLLFLKAREREAVDDLTEREFLVARLLAMGQTHKQIATRLDRSPATIRAQIRVVFRKLGINSVAMLAPLLAVRG